MIDEHDIEENTIDTGVPGIADGEAIATRPDPNSLGAILSEAIADVEAAGGREAHLLRGIIGRAAFDSLPTRKSTAQAWQAWRDAPANSKPHRLLAIAIAKAADKPHLVERIVREISDMDPFVEQMREIATPSKATPVKAQGHGERAGKVLPRAATKIAPKDRYMAMLRLAEKSDASSYIKARSAER
jgi:hypothetical protein